MSNETTRRSFFSLAAFSPLALLGLRKTEPKDEPLPHPLYGTWKKCAEEWEKSARLRDADVDHWRERALAAEDVEDLWECRALVAEKKLDHLAGRVAILNNELQKLRKGAA